jgi:hypothetical protein
MAKAALGLESDHRRDAVFGWKVAAPPAIDGHDGGHPRCALDYRLQ